MKSYLKNYRQSPRKVRLVADSIRGKKVAVALQNLAFTTKRATDPIVKLINSAVANAKNNFNVSEENLFIKEIQVNKGIVLKRIMPRARGTAARINKRSSHISITLEEKEPKAKK
jgi:large subunit ribosomal protein L22